MNCAVNVMAVHVIHRNALKLGKSSQKILQSGAVSGHQLCVQISQHSAAASTMETIEERGARDLFPKDFPGHLEEVPSAGGLAHHTADAEANEPEVIQGTLAVNATYVVPQEVNGRGKDLIQQAGIGMEIAWRKGSSTHPVRVSNTAHGRRREWRKAPTVLKEPGGAAMASKGHLASTRGIEGKARPQGV